MEAGPGDLMEFVLIEGIYHEELFIIRGSQSGQKSHTSSFTATARPVHCLARVPWVRCRYLVPGLAQLNLYLVQLQPGSDNGDCLGK